MFRWTTALVAGLLACFAADAQAVESPRLEFQKDDRVVIVGNTFAERLAQFGHFETLLHARLPDHHLVVRNLAWPADTSTLQPRPQNFGDMHTHLAEQQADVIFLCFGMNESFEGAAGLPRFERDLKGLIESLRAHKYNGKSAPRLALVSPISHEKLGGDLPDPAEHNEQLAAYVEAMRGLAAAENVAFLDLYTTVAPLMAEENTERLTINGIHLSEYGDGVVARVMMAELRLPPAAADVELEGLPADGEFQVKLPPLSDTLPLVRVKNLAPGQYTLKIGDRPLLTASHNEWAAGVRIPMAPVADATAALRKAVNEKSQLFYYRYRAVNGEYIYGRRKEPFGVVSFPPEMEQLDDMVRDLDERIWSLATPQSHKFKLVAGS